MAGFSLVVKKFIHMESASKNQLMQNLSKEEIIQQIRTNFAVYTGYYPSTTMITEKMNQHLVSCSSVNHVFFEVDPVCSILWLNHNGKIKLQDDLFKSFQFMKHLTTYGKKMFLNKHLFDILNLDPESFKFWLEPPHFESNVEKLISSIKGTDFAKDIILKKYKIAIKQHLNECEGPCKLSVIGFPTCKKNKSEIEILDKMFCGFYIFLKSETTVQFKQTLFDMIYETKQYNNFVDFIAINLVRNTSLHKIIYG